MMAFHKKGITIQPFMWVLVIVMMAFVLLFGFRSVRDVGRTADLTELATFMNRLENTVEVFSQFDVGSTKEVSFSLPRAIELICFANPGERLTRPISDDFFRGVLENEATDNVYLLPLDAYTRTTYFIDRLRVDSADNPSCISVNGMLRAEIETVLVDNQVFVEIHSL